MLKKLLWIGLQVIVSVGKNLQARDAGGGFLTVGTETIFVVLAKLRIILGKWG